MNERAATLVRRAESTVSRASSRFALRRRLPSRVAIGTATAGTAGEYLLYLAAAFLLIWPVTLHMTHEIIGTGDGEFYLWLGWRLANLMKAGHFPAVIPDANYPQHYNVALGDGYGAYLIIAFWNLIVKPYLAINLTVVTAFFLNFVAGRRLGRVVAPESRLIWILTAFAFGTAPPILLRAYGHYHLCFAFATALIVAETIPYARDGTPLKIVRVGLLLVVADLLSVYWFASSVAALTVMLLVPAIRRRETLATLGRAAAAVLLALVLLTPIIIPRIQFSHRETAAASNSFEAQDNFYNSIHFSADALSIIAQPSGSRYPLPGAGRLHRNFYPNRLESTIYPGLLLLLSLIALFFVRSRLRWPVVAATATVWILALGPDLVVDGHIPHHSNGSPLTFMPEELLYHLPATSALRTPSRLGFAIPALSAVALAVVARHAFRRLRLRWQFAATAAAAGLLVTNLVYEPYTPGGLAPQLESALISIREHSRPGDTVMEVPFDAAGQYIQTIKFQMVHRLPELGFHAQHAALPWYSDFKPYKASRALAEVRCYPPLIGYGSAPYPPHLRPRGNELAQLRRTFHVRYIFVNEALLATTPYCDARRAYIKDILSRARVLARAPGWVILENTARG
jgi:hypothetical protein